jgi:hypothetical protein
MDAIIELQAMPIASTPAAVDAGACYGGMDELGETHPSGFTNYEWV